MRTSRLLAALASVACLAACTVVEPAGAPRSVPAPARSSPSAADRPVTQRPVTDRHATPRPATSAAPPSLEGTRWTGADGFYLVFRPNHVLEWGEELGDSEGTWSQNGWSVVLKTGIDGGRITYTGTITADGRHMSGTTDVRNTNDKPTPWSVVRQ